MPPEPFYYGFLVFYAYSCIAVGVGQFAVIMCLAVVQADFAVREDQQIPVVAGSAGLISVAWMFGIILVSCPILLAADAARNLRAMR